MYFAEDTLYGPVHSEMAIDIYKKAVDDAQKQVLYLIFILNMLSFCDHQVFERKFFSFVSVIAHGNFSNPHGDA